MLRVLALFTKISHASRQNRGKSRVLPREHRIISRISQECSKLQSCHCMNFGIRKVVKTHMNNTDEVSTPPFPPLPHPLACQINQINHSDFLILAFARFLLLSYNMYLCSGWVLITLALVFRHSVKICSITFAHKTLSRVKTMKSYHHNQFLRSPESYKLLNKHIQSLDLCERCQKEIENDKH